MKDLDYEVRDRMFVESLLDIDFTETLDRGVLYSGKLLISTVICTGIYWLLSHTITNCSRLLDENIMW